MLAIWDAFNGTGTGSNVSGTPEGWSHQSYFTRTSSGFSPITGNNNYYYVHLDSGYVNSIATNSSLHAAVLVW
jgi:hypothetical protein